MISRRHFLLGTAGVLAGYGLYRNRRREIGGSILGASHAVGHRLREGKLPSPGREEKVTVVIVGGGIAGLSAAWRLSKKGFHDFLLLDLEKEVGGNSRYGVNAVSQYPWAAHYIPLAGPDSHYVTEFFEDIGVIRGRDAKGLPIYDEYYLCASPQERLFIHGRWQEGLIPQVGVPAVEREEIQRFLDEMGKYKYARGKDGRPAFTIPLDLSSRDPKFLALDKLSMARFLDDKNYKSKALRWYVDYCCRDDYGSGIESVSAWAGIHYFASRSFTASNVLDYTVLTWPEGNGFLVNKLKGRFLEKIRVGQLATRLDPSGRVDVYDVDKNESYAIKAEQIVYAGPRFTVPHLMPAPRLDIEYTPWMVGNLTVKGSLEGEDASLAWDNVFYDCQSLGYINATHQNVNRTNPRTVLTYYRPLDHLPPKESRAEAIKKTHAAWLKETLADLKRAHPFIDERAEHFDVMVWGHGMVLPKPGFLWGAQRQRSLQPLGNVHFAHSDQSGISIFEEAQYRGVLAADAILARLGRRLG